jgi:hypothetical protein
MFPNNLSCTFHNLVKCSKFSQKTLCFVCVYVWVGVYEPSKFGPSDKWNVLSVVPQAHNDLAEGSSLVHVLYMYVEPYFLEINPKTFIF